MKPNTPTSTPGRIQLDAAARYVQPHRLVAVQRRAKGGTLVGALRGSAQCVWGLCVHVCVLGEGRGERPATHKLQGKRTSGGTKCSWRHEMQLAHHIALAPSHESLTNKTTTTQGIIAQEHQHNAWGGIEPAPRAPVPALQRPACACSPMARHSSAEHGPPAP